MACGGVGHGVDGGDRMSSEVIYVVTDTLSADGWNLVLHEMTELKARGRSVLAFLLAERLHELSLPGFPLFEFAYGERENLVRRLRDERCPKIATDAKTAHLVAASGGGGLYLLTDLETRQVTSYRQARAVLSSYALDLRVITTSDCIREALLPVCPGGILLIDPGVDQVFRRPPEAMRTPAQVVYFNRGCSAEHEAAFCRAIQDVREAEPETTLAVVGERLRSSCGDVPRTFKDIATPDEFASTLQSAACFVCSFGHDMHGGGLLEAMACGCPVVATRTDVVPGFCIPGQNALVVPEGDSVALGDAVLKVLQDEDLAAHLAAEGEATAAGFDWSVHVDEVERVLRQVEAEHDTSGVLPDTAKAGRKSVSVVIPTKDAGPDFRYVLQKLKVAEAHHDIETVIVDSGSSDETVALARNFGATVIEIPPEEFSHGGTRNTGADAASGEYLVMLTQDAIPIGDDWLPGLMQPLLADPQVAASRGRDVPRSDADLFCGWMDWNHTGGLAFHADRTIDLGGSDIHAFRPSEKRSLAQLTDTCCCIRRDVFRRFRFAEVNFAEDLDLGIRLLEHGYKLAFLFSDGVVHSHNRNAFWILKRFYVDAKLIPRVLDFRPTAPPWTAGSAFSSARTLYHSVGRALGELDEAVPDVDVFEAFLALLTEGPEDDSRPNGDPGLGEFIAGLPSGGGSSNLFHRPYREIVGRFADYHRHVFAPPLGLEPDLASCFQKLCASVVGSQFGSMIASEDSSLLQEMQAVDRLLSAGV